VVSPAARVMNMRSILPGRTSACRSSCRCVSSPQSNSQLLLPLRSAIAAADLLPPRASPYSVPDRTQRWTFPNSDHKRVQKGVLGSVCALGRSCGPLQGDSPMARCAGHALDAP
jgi:hypothetical protein